jgi:hypothetical protein
MLVLAMAAKAGRFDCRRTPRVRLRRRRQLINWVAEIQSPPNVMQDWNLAGKLDDFFPNFADWHFP